VTFNYGDRVPSRRRQIFAFSGVLDSEPGTRGSFALVEHAVGLAPRAGRRRVCLIPTAVGDSARHIDAQTATFASLPEAELSVLTLFTQPNVPDVREHLLSQDVILVEGGSVVNLVAVWRAHGLPAILRECWDAGVVLAGASAGSLCWHVGGPTDSFGASLDAITDGLGLLPYSNGVHDDFPGQPRRETYRRMVGDGTLPAGYASEDGVGLHYVDTDLHGAVSIRPGKHAWWVEPTSDGAVQEKAIEPQPI
jgi:peptidase E